LPVVAIIVVPMFPPMPLTVSPLPDGHCFRHRCGLCFRGCCHLPAAMVMTCCSEKVYFSQHSTEQKVYFSEEACINGEKAGTPICVSAYLHIWVTTKSQKNQENQERIIRHRLKKYVPAGSNAYLCICIFSKEITALGAIQVLRRGQELKVEHRTSHQKKGIFS
jgi:hypothetical protein